jgi:hypothetical protein
MPGWLQVSSDDLLTDDQLTPWVERGTGYAVSAVQIVGADP